MDTWSCCTQVSGLCRIFFKKAKKETKNISYGSGSVSQRMKDTTGTGSNANRQQSTRAHHNTTAQHHRGQHRGAEQLDTPHQTTGQRPTRTDRDSSAETRHQEPPGDNRGQPYPTANTQQQQATTRGTSQCNHRKEKTSAASKEKKTAGHHSTAPHGSTAPQDATQGSSTPKGTTTRRQATGRQATRPDKDINVKTHHQKKAPGNQVHQRTPPENKGSHTRHQPATKRQRNTAQGNTTQARQHSTPQQRKRRATKHNTRSNSTTQHKQRHRPQQHHTEGRRASTGDRARNNRNTATE